MFICCFTVNKSHTVNKMFSVKSFCFIVLETRQKFEKNIMHTTVFHFTELMQFEM